MSHYSTKALNPRTGIVEEALWMDGYYGRHMYGIRFAGEEYIWREEDLKAAQAKAREDRL